MSAASSHRPPRHPSSSSSSSVSAAPSPSTTSSSSSSVSAAPSPSTTSLSSSSTASTSTTSTVPLASFNVSSLPPHLTPTPTPTLFSRLIRACDSTTLVRLLSTLSSSPTTIARLLTTHDSDGHTALHWLSFDPRPHLTTALLVYVRHSLASAAVNVDVPSRADAQRGQTPLHWAVYQGHLPLVRGLLALGASPHLADARGYNAAVHAAQYGRIDVLHILLASVDGRRRGGGGSSSSSSIGAPGAGAGESGTSGNVLMGPGGISTSISRSSSSCRGGISSELASLVRSKDHTGNSLVQWASYYDHAPMVRYLTLLYGNGATVMSASANGSHPASGADYGMDVHALGAGQAVIDVDECDDSGSNALHRAALADAYLVVDALLRSGARVDIPDARGMTVQHLFTQKKYSRTRSAMVYGMHLSNKAISGRATSYFPFNSSSSSSNSSNGGMAIAKSEDDSVDEVDGEDFDVDVEDQQASVKKKNYAQTKRLQRLPQQQQRRYQQQQQQQQQRTTDMSKRRLMYLLRRYGLVMVYYVMLVATCAVYVTRVALRGDMVVVATAGYHAVMMVCALTAGACHLRTLLGDPGDTVCMTVAQFVQYLDSLLLLPSDSSSSQTAQKDSKSSMNSNNSNNVDVNLQLLPSRFCFTCLAPRPPRSHHSRLRDRCVRRFDHDCPWVANAVGLYTHRALVALVVATLMAQTLFLLAVYRLYAVRLRAVAFWTDAPLVVVVFLNVAALVFCAFLLASQVRLIVRGATTYESIIKARRAKTARLQRPGGNGSATTSSCCHQRKGQAGHDSECNNNTNSDSNNIHSNNNNENNNDPSSTMTCTTISTSTSTSTTTTTNNNRNNGSDHDNTVHHQHDTVHTAASNGSSDPDLDSLPEYNLGACTNVLAFITMTGPGTHVGRVPRTPYGILAALLQGIFGPQQDYIHNHDHDRDQEVQLLGAEERGRHAAMASATKNRQASVAIDVDGGASSNGAAV